MNATRMLLAGAAGVVISGATACNGSIDVNAGSTKGTGPTAAPVNGGKTPGSGGKTPGSGGQAPGTGKNVPACQNRQLLVAEDPNGGDSAAGTIVNRFEITNKGTFTCKLYGHPGIRFDKDTGLPWSGLNVTRIEKGFGNLGNAPTIVLVAPSGTAEFYLRYNDTDVSNPDGTTAPCPQPPTFEFTVPPSTVWDTSIVVKYPAKLCSHQAAVSAVLPSTARP